MQIQKPFLGTVLAFLALGTCACTRHADVQRSAAADPSAVVIGTPPAPPTGDPPGTTPVDPDTTEVSKAVEQQAMPLPGQPNDHSNEAPQGSQRAQTSDINRKASTPEEGNSGASAPTKAQ